MVPDRAGLDIGAHFDEKTMPGEQLLSDNEAALGSLALERPSYMMPSMVLRVSWIPKPLSGKTDRMQLRQMAAALGPAELSLYQGRQSVFRPPSADTERRLLVLWAEVLQLSVEEISADDGFAARGGDSVGAMRLVRRAQSQGLDIFVAHFKYQRLVQQAELIDRRTQAGN
ncbi:uncharacterized protein APUU_70814S [Aspergillus puulaauensis]|uniref:Carrier domain-containing protein n=1 Tax=Aspergillus puulaauensis TaxID=1220207 RepID=A0A7R8ARE6_9EURO|nr:uncharacterized protein APUU_70814S [Aspergillus puulaauensis]BCS29244.1 hypothetical protein APUU_70814S [Aspergillus puulaauensis]